MTDTLKFFALVLGILLAFTSFSKDSKWVEEVESRLKKWEPIINKETKNATTIYHYVSGLNFEKEEWLITPLKSDDKRLAQKITLVKDKIGFWVYKEDFSFSGDWAAISEHYYNEEGRLFFVKWKMNTFQAEEPTTVEKRLYFDGHGSIVENRVSVYRMNTKQEIKASFADQPISYELYFSKLEFLKYVTK